jgi:hypothetical protein
MPSSLLQVVNSLFQTCIQQLGTSSANTTCRQLVNRLVYNNLFADLKQLVRYHVCTTSSVKQFLYLIFLTLLCFSPKTYNWRGV